MHSLRVEELEQRIAPGSFTIVPPGHDGGTTAVCVGPQFGETPNLSPWNGHFATNGNPAAPGTVIHDLSCD